MGVPGLFKNLCNKYKKQIIKTNNSEINENGLMEVVNQNLIDSIDVLFFDFNCLIHPISRLIWLTDYKPTNKPINIDEFENKVMETTIKYMEIKINEVNPSTLVGIFIDGVCPMSKIVQQRQRRFASVFDKEIMNNIKHKHNVSKDEYYDTNSITPGTEFMEKFHNYILNYVNDHNKNKNKKYLMTYSSYKKVGEGEHKIIQYIKKNIKTNQNIVIYGLDADLIILSMTLVVKNYHIYLYREHEDIIMLNKTAMIYFDVNECSRMLAKDLSNKEDEEITNQIEITKYMLDFVFITLLLGNDFIPPNPTLNMRYPTKQLNGYDILIHTYKSLNSHIVFYDEDNKLKINWEVYKELINRLATYEEQYFENQVNYRNYKKLESTNPAEIQIFRMENLMFRFPDPLQMANKNIPYNTRKQRYIHHYFGSNACDVFDSKNNKYNSQLLLNNTDIIDEFYDDKQFKLNNKKYDNIIETYLGTMAYIMAYYFNECPDYLYYYKGTNAILLSDLYEFLNKNNNNFLNSIILNFSLNRNNKYEITPLMQLMLVLPVKSFNLLPKKMYEILTNDINQTNELKNLLTLYKSYFPKNPKRDFLNKNKLFQASLILNVPNINLITSLLLSIKVSKEEEQRNEMF